MVVYKVVMPHKDKEVEKIYKKQYYKEHREEKLAWQKKYHEDHREKRLIQMHKYDIIHREEKRQYSKDHPEINLRTKKKLFAKLGKILDLSHGSMKYALMSWSKTVRKRDNNKCTWCNSTEKLVSHHIWHKAYCPESALDVDNGITLCHDCHMEQHRLDKSFS